MRWPRIDPRRPTLALGALLAGLSPSAAGIALVEPVDGQWMAPERPVVLRLEEPGPMTDGRLRVFIGKNDVTGACSARPSGELGCSAAMVPLAAGNHEIVVYLVSSAEDWREMARFPVQLLTGTEPDGWEVAPSLDLDQASEIDGGSSAGTVPPPSPGPRGLASHAGLATRWHRNGSSLRSAWNLLGAFGDATPLRFPTMGASAPDVDLSDYLIELQAGGARLGLGHVSHGDHPLVLNGLSHRGLRYLHRIGRRMDVGFAAQSGRIVTGYSRMLGIQSDDYIASASAGLELVASRPGAMRLSFLALSGETRSAPDFNTGQVPDAEKNTGGSVRLSGSTPGSRLRGAAEFAGSRYTNPEDPLLSQGLNLVPVREETSDASSLDLALDLVRGSRVGATLQLQYGRSSPLYRSVGALVPADQEHQAATLQGRIGTASFLALHSVAEDNVNDVPTLLKTRTRATHVSLALPIPAGAPWLPDHVSQSYARTDQAGQNLPPSFDPTTHIPDQVTEIAALGLHWNAGANTIDYQLLWNALDNRQPARERADYRNLAQRLNVGLPLSVGLRVGLSLHAESTDDGEASLTRTVHGCGFDLDWSIGRGFGLRGNVTLTDTGDTADLAASRSFTALTELDYRFRVPTSRTRRGQARAYLRHVSGGFESTDRVFSLSTDVRTWSIQGGLSLHAF